MANELMLLGVGAAGTGVAVPPTLQYIQVSADGSTFDFIFDRNVTATDASGLTVTASGGASTLTYSSGSNSRRLRFTASRPVAVTETITVDGDGSTSIASASGGAALAAFADVPAYTYVSFGMDETALNPAWNPTVRSIAAGQWTADAATVWDTGAAPTATDRVLVTHAVTVDDTTAAAGGLLIDTGGTLAFDATVDTELTVDTIVVAGSGAWQQGTSGARVDSAKTSTVTFRDTALPDQQLDPMQTHAGFIATEDAVVDIYGAVKTTEATDCLLAVEPLAGATTLTLAAAPTNWNIGDKIIIADTRPFNFSPGDHLEVRTIANIVGAVITLDTALTYDHPCGRDTSGTVDTYFPIVNVSRNVIFRSANSSGTRGHTAFSQRATVNAEYALAQNLGRTENDSIFGTNGTITDDGVVTNGIVTHYGTNQKGRYPWHCHHLFGPTNAGNTGNQFRLIGLSTDDAKKWSLAIHRSHYGLIQGCNFYDATHAHIALESGNESYHEFIENIIVKVVNDGSFTIADGYWGLSAAYNTWTNNYGLTITQDNAGNVATYQGHVFHLLDGLHRGGTPAGDGVFDRFPLKRGVDIDDAGAVEGVDYEVLALMEATFTDFSGNGGFGSTKGFSKDHWGRNGVTITLDGFVTSGMGKESVFDYGAPGETHLVNNDTVVRNWGEFGYAVNEIHDDSTHIINRPDIQQYAENAPNSNTTGFQWIGGTGDPVQLAFNGPGTIAAYYPATVYFTTLGQDPGPPTATAPEKVTVFDGMTLTPLFGSSTEIRMAWGDQGTPVDPCGWEQAFVFNRSGESWQLFWDEQASDATCATSASGYGATVEGNTNAEEFALSGRASGGELMPAGAATQSWLSGGKAIALLSGVVDADGVTVTLTASAAITTDGTGWSVTGSTTGAVGLTYVSGSGSKTLVFTAASTLVSGETVTGAYASATGDAETTAGGVVLPDVGFAVTNNSTQTTAGTALTIGGTDRLVIGTTVLRIGS